jgi:hypothetical protein
MMCCRNHPSVMLAVLHHLTARIRELTERVFEFSTLAVRNRVHAELVRLAREHGGGKQAVIRPAPTHSEMASRISTHREAVTRELSRLHELGIIAREGRALRVTTSAGSRRWLRMSRPTSQQRWLALKAAVAAGASQTNLRPRSQPPPSPARANMPGPSGK